MFVTQEVTLPLSFGLVRARLLGLVAGDWLNSACREAFGEGWSGMARAGPSAGVPCAPKLIRVRSLSPQPDDHLTCVPLRWEASGPTGSLFPLLDGNIALLQAGKRTRLVLSGSYRLRLDWFGTAVDRPVMNHVAAVTFGALLRKVAQQLDPGQPVYRHPLMPSENGDHSPQGQP